MAILTQADPILFSRLDAISEAQKRARVALFAGIVATGALLGGLWNEYLAWDRQWADWTKAPDHFGQQKVLESTINYWVESNTVGVSLLGLRFMISDVAVLGTLVLLIFSFYHALCLRRETTRSGASYKT
jgi:hypothetical protein